VLHCPYCHGYEVRDRALGVLVGGPHAIRESIAHAHLIRQWSDNVVIFTNGVPITTDQRQQLVARAIGVVYEPVVGLVVDDDQLTAVQVGPGRVVPRAAVFVKPDFVPNDALLADLGCAVRDNGWVAIDPTGATSVEGVWAAGNAVDPRAQVITAAGEGSAAAIAINNDLVQEDVALAVDIHQHGRPD
jgi:thioredoxin reductase